MRSCRTAGVLASEHSLGERDQQICPMPSSSPRETISCSMTRHSMDYCGRLEMG
jgi:hypothetical protein